MRQEGVQPVLFSHLGRHQFFLCPLLKQSSRDLVLEHMAPVPLLERSEAPSASNIEILQKGFLFRSSPLHEVMALALVVQVQATAISYHSPPGGDSSLLPSFSQRDLHVGQARSHHTLLNPSAVSYRQWMTPRIRPFQPRSTGPLLCMLQTQACLGRGVPSCPSPESLHMPSVLPKALFSPQPSPMPSFTWQVYLQFSA